MITNIWLFINSLLYIGIGLFSFIYPAKVAKTVGFVLSNSQAYAELKACYGGLMIAIGILTLYAIMKNKPLGLMFMGSIYLGFASGRLLGIIFNQAHDQTTLAYFAFETFATIVSFTLLAKS